MMSAPSSQNLRKHLVRAVEKGASAREAAAPTGFSASAAIKLMRSVRETGSTAPLRIKGYHKPLLAEQKKFSRELAGRSILKRLGLSNKKALECK